MESNENVKVEEEVKDTPLTEETNNEVNNPESAAEEQTEETTRWAVCLDKPKGAKRDTARI